MRIIIEGLDRVGKSLLITNIIKSIGYHHVVHYGKPIQSSIYNNSLEEYQKQSFIKGFELLINNTDIIFDRFILGECVYAHRYRDYDGDYVFEYEENFNIQNYNDVFLILLTCSDTSIMVDDGESHDFSMKNAEQEDFISAYNKSIIMHKMMLNIYDPKTCYYKSEEAILDHVLSFLKISHAITDFRVL